MDFLVMENIILNRTHQKAKNYDIVWQKEFKPD